MPEPLPRRDPQQSEGARLDRTLSWTGRIIPLPEPCTDAALMARVLDGLHQLPDGDAAPTGENTDSHPTQE